MLNIPPGAPRGGVHDDVHHALFSIHNPAQRIKSLQALVIAAAGILSCRNAVMKGFITAHIQLKSLQALVSAFVRILWRGAG